MAKHVILEKYTFTPSTRTVVITGKSIRIEQLLLITNVTTGNVIYNFSDPTIGSSAYTISIDGTTGQETTTIVLEYDTTSMSLSDKLSILTEETYQEIIPSELMRDPVDKLRVSQPQSLIDTDFEYGTQPTKWESITLLNNRPSAFYDATAPLTVTAATASSKVVTISTSSPPAVGTPIFVTGTLDPVNADGWWVVESISAGVSFTYTVTNTPATALYDSTKTYVYSATFYTGAAIPAGVSAITIAGGYATVTTTNCHGLQPGNGIYIVGTTGATGTLNSSWVVYDTPTTNTFRFVTAATGSITTVSNASIYPRSLGYVVHRPFDGGVQFSNVSPYQGYQLVRQTRRYFRYQSGKGIQFSTGSILKPALSINDISYSSPNATVTCRQPHGLLPGATVRIYGATETAYNGTFAVLTAPTLSTFTYQPLSAPSANTATGFPINVTPSSWYGSSTRLGMFDSQNGFYFEFDGTTLYAVRRSSTAQISGTCTVTNGGNTITGTSTKFSSQLKPGDFVVIRGQSYIVQAITSDTNMHIYPEYRGTTVSVSSVVISKTVNTRYAQSSWNIDTCDGNGASKFSLDLDKMQMFYIDYSWYGAGAIRFGFKNNRGEVIYCHRIVNNNINTEAYMRSGNLPSRYETNTIPPYTYLTASLASGTGVSGSINVSDTSGFPSSGTVILSQAANTSGQIEYVTYTSKTSNALVIGSRAAVGGAASAQTFTYSATAPIQVELYSPQNASTISHWGSSVVMDGRFDDDKSFVFNYGMNTPVTYATAATRYPVFTIRLAPSVDNGITGLLGAREIINRMQLTLQGASVLTTTAGVRIELLLNARLGGSGNGTFAAIGGSSLAQAALHANTSTVSGGESIFTFFAPAGGVTAEDLSRVRDLGTSILGGGTANTVPTSASNMYPDGPDTLTLCVTPLAINAAVAARINWTEAQA
jgi:hypothetical protein